MRLFIVRFRMLDGACDLGAFGRRCGRDFYTIVCLLILKLNLMQLTDSRRQFDLS